MRLILRLIEGTINTTRTKFVCYKTGVNNDRTIFTDPVSDQLRMRAFEKFFKEAFHLKLTTDSAELMNRECALFFNNRYLIVGSSENLGEENLPSYNDLASNNESIHFSSCENYTIYLIDVEHGNVCDKLKFKADKISLAHNQSLGLFGNVFAVLSQQNQTIHVYNLVSNLPASSAGPKFVLIQSIGRFAFSDDSEYINNLSARQAQSSSLRPVDLTKPPVAKKQSSLFSYRTRRMTNFNFESVTIKPFAETAFTSMKQRLITYFYKEALEANALNQFYFNLNNLLNLKMYKMQLLDTRFLLIKYVNFDQLVNQKLTISPAVMVTSSANVNASANASIASQAVNNPNQMVYILIFLSI